MSSKTPSAHRLTDFALGMEHHRLVSGSGLEVDVTNYGATLTAIRVPDRYGRFADVALGFNRLVHYLNAPRTAYLGAVVGRCANRIRGGRATIGGEEFQLNCNDHGHHLHGGNRGFDVRLWQAQMTESGLVLNYTSQPGEEEYPGKLHAQVTYRVGTVNSLHIIYEAWVEDAPTLVNMTNHTYFNLKGESQGDILDHELMIAADHFTPVGEDLIPTGEIRPVEGTPMDFRQNKLIGKDIDADDPQLRFTGGYDHNFVLRKNAGPGQAELCAIVREPASGRVLRILTTEPGVQFYSGNFLDGTLRGKSGAPYLYRGGFCLETQRFPDAPNQPNFPSVELQPGETYRSETVFAFSAAE